MPDWISPVRLLLVVVPVAMILAVLALAAGQRRARARRARDSLGRPEARIDGAAEGERVLVEGTLHVVEGPCARFEDGAACAAATVESTGYRALRNGVLGPLVPGSEPSVAHGVRAKELSLTVGSERVALEGPVDVFVGSREVDPDAPLHDLSTAVRERIVGVADQGSLPGPDVTGAVHARPLFRSVASGDRVRAAGVLVKRSEGERTGYRERARWALRGEKASPVVLAFEQTPRFRGPVRAALAGVRPVPWLSAMGGLAVATAAVAWLAAVVEMAPLPPAQRPAVNATARPHLADPARCEVLVRQHAEAVERMGTCVIDDDCQAEVRGGAYHALEGCHRYKNRDLSGDAASAIAAAWLDEGCAAAYEICPPRAEAMCRNGQCAERPPGPIPSSWHREEVAGGFFLYVPPEVTRRPAGGDDPLVTLYEGGGLRIRAELGDGVHVLEGLDRTEEGTPTKVGGHPARVWKSARAVTLHFEESRPGEPPRCSHAGQSDELLVHATCETEAQCTDAWLALQSVRFW